MMRDEAFERTDETRRVDLKSRIGARAIVSGTFVALAVLSVLLSLIGAFTPMLDVHVVEHFGFGTYLWALVSLVSAVFAGAFVAARIGRACSVRDGGLYGIVTWAATCVTGAVLMCTWYMAAVGVGVISPTFGDTLVRPEVFRAYFAADALALVFAIAAGVLGARSERRATARGEIERAAPIGGQPAPAAT